MKKTRNTLVALAPAFVRKLAGYVVTVGHKLTQHWNAFKHSKHNVETLKEVISHMAFYGAAFGGFFGFHTDSHLGLFITVMWFLSLILITFRLAQCLDEMEHDSTQEP